MRQNKRTRQVIHLVVKGVMQNKRDKVYVVFDCHSCAHTLRTRTVHILCYII